MKHARLWKRILNEGMSSIGSDPRKIQQVVNKIIASPIIVDTRAMPDKIPSSVDLSQFTSLAMPFDEFWIEGMKLVSVRFGAIVRSEETSTGRQVIASCILDIDGNPPEVLGGFEFALSDDGMFGGRVQVHVSPAMAARNPAKKIGDYLYVCAYATCDTLSMLSCKNVSLEPRDNDPKQVRRAVKRHGGNPDSYRYHVLVVRPPGAKSNAPAQEIGIMPRHVCRGHFAEYGPEYGKGLLFGKYSGRFYVPPHMKGRKENGMVAKDYAIR